MSALKQLSLQGNLQFQLLFDLLLVLFFISHPGLHSADLIVLFVIICLHVLHELLDDLPMELLIVTNYFLCEFVILLAQKRVELR